MPYDIKMDWDELPRQLQPDVMTKWPRIKYRQKWHDIPALMVKMNKAKPKTPLTKVKIHCIRWTNYKCDDDNLRYSFKPLIDGMVRAKVLAGDGPTVIVSSTYERLNAKKSARGITIRITEVI